jgi:hypothetical protein
MLGSSRVAAQLAASREGLGSMSDDDDIYMRSVAHTHIYIGLYIHLKSGELG